MGVTFPDPNLFNPGHPRNGASRTYLLFLAGTDLDRKLVGFLTINYLFGKYPDRQVGPEDRRPGLMP